MTAKRASFTPGPWQLEKLRAPNGALYYRITTQDNPCNAPIAQVIGNVGHIDRYHHNARLIAAAPELLEACEKALDEFPRNPSDPRIAEAVDMLHAALAKARGES